MRTAPSSSPGERNRLGFDLTTLSRAGVELRSLPDESGNVIEATSLPAEFAEHLKRNGLDMSKPLRVVGRITRLAGGGLGHYVIYFEEA